MCIADTIYRYYLCYHSAKKSLNDWGITRYEIEKNILQKPSILKTDFNVWYLYSLTTKEKNTVMR